MRKSQAADDFSYRPWIAPQMTPQRRADIARAAALHAEANPSDPFGTNRVIMHMKRGLALPSDVIKDARSQIEARRNAIANRSF